MLFPQSERRERRAAVGLSYCEQVSLARNRNRDRALRGIDHDAGLSGGSQRGRCNEHCENERLHLGISILTEWGIEDCDVMLSCLYQRPTVTVIGPCVASIMMPA